MQTVSLKRKITSQEELPSLTLPKNWWSKNYSYNYYSKEENPEVQLFKFEPPINDEIEFNEIKDENIQSSINGWDYSHGDYYVNDRNFKNKAKKQKNKAIFANNFLYIGIAFAVFITLIVLNIVVSL